MKKVLICTKHRALAECVSKWLENQGCKLYRLVGDASRVTKKLREKIEEFDPDFLITGYTNSIDAHVGIINQAKAVKKDISTYVFHGHPEVLRNSGDYGVFSDLYPILKEIVDAQAA